MSPAAAEPDPAAPERAQFPTSSWLLLAALCAVAVLARWLTRSPVVYNWDSVHYVLAQDRYDILAHQPHPPGSWYYVLLARATRLLTGDAHTALLLLSALSGTVFVIGLFLLARDLGGARAGWMAAAIGASAPLLWFYGAVGLNYAPGGALSLLAALGCVRLCLGIRPLSSGLLAGAALGLLGGFRPTDVVFLAPAYLAALVSSQQSVVSGQWSVVSNAQRPKTHAERRTPNAQRPTPNTQRLPALWSLAAFGVLTLGWLVPNVLNAGGLEGYLRSIQNQEHLLRRTSAFLAGWPALSDALFTHRRCLQSTLGVAWVPALLGLVGWWGGGVARWLSRTRPPPPHHPTTPPSRHLILVGSLIVLPAGVFYLVGHFNSPGYSLTYAGFLAALGAALSARLLDSIERWGKGSSPTAPLPHHLATHIPLLLILAGNTALFLYGWPGVGNVGQRSLSYAEIADHALYYQELRAFLESRHRPGEARILASWNSTDGLRVVETLVPEYAGDVAQAVGEIPALPHAVASLPWLHLMTPAQIRAEGRPVYAVARSREDAPYHRDPELFGDRWEIVPIGPRHEVYRLR